MSEVVEDQAALVADLMARADAAEAELERWRASARLGWLTARNRLRLVDELQGRLERIQALEQRARRELVKRDYKGAAVVLADDIREVLAGQS